MVQPKTIVIIIVVIVVLILLGVGGYFLYKWIESFRLQPGDICTEGPLGNLEYTSGACGKTDAGAAFRCCETGATCTDGGAIVYCAGKGEGAPCTHNCQCTTNYCDSSLLHPDGACKPQLQPGDRCDLAAIGICSTACGYVVGDKGLSENTVCCPKAKTVEMTSDQNTSIPVCADIAPSYYCLADDQCVSGTKCVYASGQIVGTCQGLTPRGGNCSVDSDCNNATCAHPSASGSSQQICCPSDNQFYSVCMARSFCTKSVPNGNQCHESSECVSGKCNDIRTRDNNFCPTGICEA